MFTKKVKFKFFFVITVIFNLFYSQTEAQVFIPHSFWQCKKLSTSFSDSSSSDFTQGTFLNTNVSGNSVVLSAGNFSGTYTSAVRDLFGGCPPLAPWLQFSWLTPQPYYKELPITSEVALDYSSITVGLLTNLVGYWKLNETSGTSFADSSGNADTGTKQGSLVLGATGQLLNAVSLDGTTAYISTAKTFANPNLFTESVWFKTTTITGGKLIGLGNVATGSSSNYDRHLFMANSGQIYFGVYPGAVKTVNSPGSYNDGKWHQAVGTLSASGLRLYVDGSLVAADATTTSAQNYTGYIRIGYDNLSGWGGATPTSFYFKGLIDDVAFWTRALSGTEISQLYQRGASRIKFQIRACDLSDCSDIASFYGPNSTAGTYFSELNNNSIPNTGLGNVQSASPRMVFSDFPLLTVPVKRYFQYKAFFETDNTSFMPILGSITTKQGCTAGSQVFTLSGSWTLPAGCTSFVVTALGGGGGSAAASASPGAKAAGAAGGRAVKTFISQTSGTVYTISIGKGGLCNSTAGAGGYAGGAGGVTASCSGGLPSGSVGGGTGAGGAGGAPFLSTNCAGGAGKYGGGGGGGGATAGLLGGGGGGATVLSLSGTDYIVAGGGGASGAGDGGGGGTGGSACSVSGGYAGGNGSPGNFDNDPGSGGGGGACYCLGGTCDAAPTSAGGAGGDIAGTACQTSNNGTDGSMTISWP